MNLQEPEGINHSPYLELHSVFHTVQGEGPFAGRVAVFVRLAGCNLQCPLCDTDYTSKRERLSVPSIVGRVKALLSEHNDLVVITGGEPFRHAYLAELCLELTEAGYIVQIETNGRLGVGFGDEQIFRRLTHDGNLHIVVSPKTPRVAGFIADIATAWKYVVDVGNVAEDGLPTMSLDHPGGVARPPEYYEGVIYINPADAQDPFKNSKNRAAAVRAVFMDPARRRLGLQMHKVYELE